MNVTIKVSVDCEDLDFKNLCRIPAEPEVGIRGGITWDSVSYQGTTVQVEERELDRLAEWLLGDEL